VFHDGVGLGMDGKKGTGRESQGGGSREHSGHGKPGCRCIDPTQLWAEVDFRVADVTPRP
jgi:hypothetical protein